MRASHDNSKWKQPAWKNQNNCQAGGSQHYLANIYNIILEDNNNILSEGSTDLAVRIATDESTPQLHAHLFNSIYFILLHVILSHVIYFFFVSFHNFIL